MLLFSFSVFFFRGPGPQQKKNTSPNPTPKKVPKMTPWGSLEVRLQLHSGLCMSLCVFSPLGSSPPSLSAAQLSAEAPPPPPRWPQCARLGALLVRIFIRPAGVCAFAFVGAVCVFVTTCPRDV